MTGQGGYVRDWFRDGLRGWDRFWFTPADAATLSLIRICTGAMLFYTHLVWSLRLEAFFGPRPWLTPEAAMVPGREWAWSFFYWIDAPGVYSPALLWSVHIAALVVFALLTLGICTRVTSVLAFLAAVSYANRAALAATFGLDDTNIMLALYLMIGASGAYYSFDAWWAKRRGRAGGPAPGVATNIAIRLLQLHLCIVYLFSGIGKLLGPSWWDGTAVWHAIGNLEYQSLDMTWLAHYPHLMNAMTHLALFWEVFYIALVWPRWTRPLALGMAVFVHGGIALFLGMMTFGLVMIIANLAFLSPDFVRSIIGPRLALPPEQTVARSDKSSGKGRGAAAQR